MILFIVTGILCTYGTQQTNAVYLLTNPLEYECKNDTWQSCSREYICENNIKDYRPDKSHPNYLDGYFN